MKALHRSVRDRVLGGVCGGLAETFDLDPGGVRAATVILSLFTGMPILAYLVLWLVLKEGE